MFKRTKWSALLAFLIFSCSLLMPMVTLAEEEPSNPPKTPTSITSVEIAIAAPVVGEIPAASATLALKGADDNSSITDGAQVTGIKWTSQQYPDTPLGNDAKIEGMGFPYTATVTIKANTGYEFAKNEGGSIATTITAANGGKPGTPSAGEDNTITVPIVFDRDPAKIISAVVIDLPTPAVGAIAPATAAAVVKGGTDEQTTLENALTASITWTNSSQQILTAGTDKFEDAGFPYVATVKLVPTTGFMFSVTQINGMNTFNPSITIQGNTGSKGNVTTVEGTPGALQIPVTFAKDNPGTGYTISDATEENANGSITWTKTDNAETGETIVFVTASPNAGYQLNTITVSTENETIPTYVSASNPNVYSFSMPDANVSVAATFEERRQYNITLDPANGGNVSCTVNGVPSEKAYVGDTVIIKAAPEMPYDTAAVRASCTYRVDTSGKMTGNTVDWTFIMPKGDTAVTTTFLESKTIGSFQLEAPQSVERGETFALTLRGTGDGIDGGITATGAEIKSVNSALCSLSTWVLLPSSAMASASYTCVATGTPGSAITFATTNAMAAYGTYGVPIPNQKCSVQIANDAPKTYSISPASSTFIGGSVFINPTMAKQGDTVQLTINPDTGYYLSALSTTPRLTISGTGNIRTFTMPAANVTVNAVFAQVSPTVVPTYNPSPNPTYYPTYTPPVTTATPAPSASSSPSTQPSPSRSPQPSPTASSSPSSSPSASPSAAPTEDHTSEPTAPAAGVIEPNPDAPVPGESSNPEDSTQVEIIINPDPQPDDDTADESYIIGIPITPDQESASQQGTTVAEIGLWIKISDGSGNISVETPSGTPAAPQAPLSTGMIVKVTNSNGIVTAEATIVIKGDVLGTGKMDIAQLVRAAQDVNGVNPLRGAFLSAGKWNNRPGKLNIVDIVKMAHMLTRTIG